METLTETRVSVAHAMMKNMGWTEGEGLGKDKQGMKAALQPKKKIDATGLGAQKYNTNWLQTSAAYDAILAKLNVAHKTASDEDEEDEVTEDEEEKLKQKEEKDRKKKEKKEKKKEKKEKKRKREDADDEERVETKEERRARRKQRKEEKARAKESSVSDTEKEAEAETDKPKALPARHFMYAKRLKAKQVCGYSVTDKAEIFAEEFREKPKAAPVALPYMPNMRPQEAVQTGSFVGDEEEDDYDDEDTVVKQHISYEGGFTEDTQVDIYNLAMSKQIKGRIGLGQAKLSKSSRREKAQQDAILIAKGSYLSRKFVYGGVLGQKEEDTQNKTPQPCEPSPTESEVKKDKKERKKDKKRRSRDE